MANASAAQQTDEFDESVNDEPHDKSEGIVEQITDLKDSKICHQLGKLNHEGKRKSDQGGRPESQLPLAPAAPPGYKNASRHEKQNVVDGLPQPVGIFQMKVPVLILKGQLQLIEKICLGCSPVSAASGQKGQIRQSRQKQQTGYTHKQQHDPASAFDPSIVLSPVQTRLIKAESKINKKPCAQNYDAGVADGQKQF